MICLQLILYCALFAGMVMMSVRGGAVNALYFYPEEYKELAFARALADRKETASRRIHFMIPFCIVMFLALVMIVGGWNRTVVFRTAYLQSLLFLEVMNWFDGIVIDEVWVGTDPRWKIKGMEGIPYRKPWKVMFKVRILVSFIFVVLACIPAGVSVILARCL